MPEFKYDYKIAAHLSSKQVNVSQTDLSADDPPIWELGAMTPLLPLRN